MMNKSVVFAAVIMAMTFSSAAFAEEKLMVLWPKQRAAHQNVMDEHTAAYKARGQAYIDHLYETGGETPMEPDSAMDGNAEIQPVPVNVGQVADMVKDAAGSSSLEQTGATPQ